jgi:hypothetical protein
VPEGFSDNSFEVIAEVSFSIFLRYGDAQTGRVRSLYSVVERNELAMQTPAEFGQTLVFKALTKASVLGKLKP